MKIDQADRAQFRNIFITTTQTWIKNLIDSLALLKIDPTNADALAKSFIAAHSLKGDGAMMGYEKLAALSHIVEDIFYELKGGKLVLSAELNDALEKCYKHLSIIIDKVEAAENNPEANTDELISQLKALTGVTTEGIGKSQRKT